MGKKKNTDLNEVVEDALLKGLLAMDTCGICGKVSMKLMTCKWGEKFCYLGESNCMREHWLKVHGPIPSSWR